jgi:RNA polymerase sigma-70 factor (ECF subfamily)
LIRIAINLAHDHLKSRRASFWRRLLRAKERDAQALPDRRQDPEASMLAREQVAGLWSAVQQLPLRQRTAFLLRFGAEMPLQEIARAMKVREGTVKAHLSHAVAAVRRRVRRG